MTLALSVLELALPSLAVRLNAGATSLPSSANCTRPPASCALVKLPIATPGAPLNWKMPPLKPLTV